MNYPHFEMNYSHFELNYSHFELEKVSSLVSKCLAHLIYSFVIHSFVSPCLIVSLSSIPKNFVSFFASILICRDFGTSIL